jgi:hypothetical protein
MMRNADFGGQLVELERAAAELRKALAESAELEPLPLAEGLVAGAALNRTLAKLAGRVRKQLAALFADKPARGDGGRPPGRPAK